MFRAQIIDWDPGHAPLFYRDLRDVGFFFKEFIYLCGREPTSERGNTSREWESKMQAPREEPDEGLLSGTLGSRPKQKTGAQ